MAPVTGAGNAVGHCVTQLAVLQGARVIGTAGSGKTQLALAEYADTELGVTGDQEPDIGYRSTAHSVSSIGT